MEFLMSTGYFNINQLARFTDILFPLSDAIKLKHLPSQVLQKIF